MIRKISIIGIFCIVLLLVANFTTDKSIADEGNIVTLKDFEVTLPRVLTLNQTFDGLVAEDIIKIKPLSNNFDKSTTITIELVGDIVYEGKNTKKKVLATSDWNKKIWNHKQLKLGVVQPICIQVNEKDLPADTYKSLVKWRIKIKTDKEEYVKDIGTKSIEVSGSAISITEDSNIVSDSTIVVSDSAIEVSSSSLDVSYIK